jgi:hypothetical protein
VLKTASRCSIRCHLRIPERAGWRVAVSKLDADKWQALPGTPWATACSMP